MEVDFITIYMYVVCHNIFMVGCGVNYVLFFACNFVVLNNLLDLRDERCNTKRVLACKSPSFLFVKYFFVFVLFPVSLKNCYVCDCEPLLKLVYVYALL